MPDGLRNIRPLDRALAHTRGGNPGLSINNTTNNKNRASGFVGVVVDDLVSRLQAIGFVAAEGYLSQTPAALVSRALDELDRQLERGNTLRNPAGWVRWYCRQYHDVAATPSEPPPAAPLPLLPDAHQVWSTALELLRPAVNDTNYATYLEPIGCLGWAGTELRLSVPSHLLGALSRFRALIARAVNDAARQPVTVACIPVEGQRQAAV